MTGHHPEGKELKLEHLGGPASRQWYPGSVCSRMDRLALLGSTAVSLFIDNLHPASLTTCIENLGSLRNGRSIWLCLSPFRNAK
ncbi:MAG: hypothetical protein CMK60_09065 [Proteobacteria bacterium]|nr:hypothetical protein [Pseudomonadota bacterium]MBV05051.1 hypothetical protein [Acidobacteriota bacterium]HCF72597.1 hypothetical protein [Gammaproteobacteria bacterium]